MPNSVESGLSPEAYLITDRRQTNGRPLLDVLEEALNGGVRMVQLREKDLPGKKLFELAAKVRELTRNYGAKLLINDRVDIAIAVDADGVHLPADSFAPDEARALLGDDRIIGVSTHSVDEAVGAEKDGADFLTFSPIYYTPSKAVYGEPQGVEKLKEVCESVDIPVYALGGINAERINEVTKAGAYGVAVISAILSVEDVRGEARRIVALLINHRGTEHGDKV